MDVIKELGGPAVVGRLLDITVHAVSQWKGVVPHGRVLDLYYACDGKVSPYQMRPDLYPDPEWVPPPKSASRQVA